MASSRITRKIVGHGLAVLSAVLFVSCSSGGNDAVEGVQVFDEMVALERGEKNDSAHREFAVDADATFVTIIEEGDNGVSVALSHSGAPNVEPALVKVAFLMGISGIELACVDAPRSARLTVTLEGSQTLDRPGSVRIKLLRFDSNSANSRAAARLSAYRAWCDATTARSDSDDYVQVTLRNLDRAIAHFESGDGDPTLAAWGHLLRAKIHHRQLQDLDAAMADARTAEQQFASIGQLQNAARARQQQASTLMEISHDTKAENPGPEEAAREARKILTELTRETATSALERATAVNNLGVLAFYNYDLPEARARFLEAIKAYRAIGDQYQTLKTLGNLGSLAVEEGDYRGATRYYDQVIAGLQRFESLNSRAVMLHNAARVDTFTGNIDRAIERYLQGLELTRTTQSKPNQARILQGLGIAYWARGDIAQATAFSDEALKIRREIDDAYGLAESLGVVGVLAREAGDSRKALDLHREAVPLVASDEARVTAVLDLAIDYQSASDYPRAIATAREAMAIRADDPNFYRRYEVLQALAEMLLSQPGRTSQSLREARRLAQDSLDAAAARADTRQEIVAWQLLAQAHVAENAPREARLAYERAIATDLKFRSAITNPDLRASTVAHEQKMFRGYVDLLMRDITRRSPDELRPATASEEEALRTLEWARAVNFDSRRFTQLEPAVQAHLDGLLVQMADERVRIETLLDRGAESREMELRRLDIARMRAEVDRLWAGSRQASEATGSISGAPHWPALLPGVTQLSYAMETQHAYVWVRDSTGLRAAMLAASPETIRRELENFSTAVRSRSESNLDASFARLSIALLPAGAIAANTSTVEIVAEGQITRVPFAALRIPSEPAQTLSQTRSIVMIASMFEPRAATTASRPHKWGFVALANDARSSARTPAAQVFPALPTTNAEARSIAAMFLKQHPPPQVKLLLGEDGNAGHLKEIWHDGIDAIHFATHGLADLRQPLASLLLMPALDAAGNPSYLTAGQVQQWRGEANLVYLSACDTAVGPARFADGLPGLQRAFLHAGARGVVATLWPLEDVYASQFASDFYRRYTAGMPAAQALSETQRAWMTPAPGIRATERLPRRMTAWAHAFYTQ
jgi:CHAT domain-containing protein